MQKGKGKVFSKRHIVTSVLVVCLAAAVWLNMKYSSFDNNVIGANKNSSDTEFIDKDSNLGQAVQTGTGVDKIATARQERNDNRSKTVADLTKVVNNSSVDSKAKDEALKGLNLIAEQVNAEASMETVIKLKGFEDALAIISTESVTVIVPAENLLTSQTLQIQDAVISQKPIDLEKIKIIAVK